VPEYGFVSKPLRLEEGVVDLTPEFSERLGVVTLSDALDDPAGVVADLPDTASDLLVTLDGLVEGCVLASPDDNVLEGLAAVVVLLALCKSGL